MNGKREKKGEMKCRGRPKKKSVFFGPDQYFVRRTLDVVIPSHALTTLARFVLSSPYSALDCACA